MFEQDVQVNLVKVSAGNEEDWITKLVEAEVKPVRSILDKFGEKYKHEFPWKDSCLVTPKLSLYRVGIGAVGRINTCADAIKIGVSTEVPVKSIHFTSSGLYYIFRLTRIYKRQLEMTRSIEKWVNRNFCARRRTNSLRFMNCVDAGGDDPDSVVNDAADEFWGRQGDGTPEE